MIEDHITYIVTEDGKIHKAENVLAHHQRLERIDQIRHEATQKRQWYREHVKSYDDGSGKWYTRIGQTDSGRSVNRIVNVLDRYWDRQRQDTLIHWAAVDIAVELGLVQSFKVERFIRAVVRNGVEGREQTLRDFKISLRTYYWRLKQYTKLLSSGGCVNC